MEVDTILKFWLIQHLEVPFANADDRKLLAEQTNLSELQVSNWFRNARRKKWFKNLLEMHSKGGDSSDDYKKHRRKILNLKPVY